MDLETLDEVWLTVSYLLDVPGDVTGEMLDTYLAMWKALDSGLPPHVSTARHARIYMRVMDRLSAIEATYEWLIFDLENDVLLQAT